MSSNMSWPRAHIESAGRSWSREDLSWTAVRQWLIYVDIHLCHFAAGVRTFPPYDLNQVRVECLVQQSDCRSVSIAGTITQITTILSLSLFLSPCFFPTVSSLSPGSEQKPVCWVCTVWDFHRQKKTSVGVFPADSGSMNVSGSHFIPPVWFLLFSSGCFFYKVKRWKEKFPSDEENWLLECELCVTLQPHFWIHLAIILYELPLEERVVTWVREVQERVFLHFTGLPRRHRFLTSPLKAGTQFVQAACEQTCTGGFILFNLSIFSIILSIIS